MTALTAEGTAVEDLPPSCTLVYLVLDHADGPLSVGEIATRTTLSYRTARWALDRMDEHRLVESDPDLGDLRKTLYGLRDDQ